MRLASEVTGRGPALVCVHGWGVSGAIWEGLRQRLAGDLTVRTVDLPGHGNSPAGAVGLNNWTDLLLEAVPEPSVYLGWSLGGLLCLQAAVRDPQRVRALVLVDSLPRMLRGPDWPWGMKASAVAETARGLESDYVSTLQEFLMLQILGEPGARRLVRGLRNQLLERPPDPEGLKRGLEILHEVDLRPVLADIQAPTLVINGERDRMCHPDAAAWVAEQLPDARLWRVARAAHAPFLSHEREFSERVTGFVRSLGDDG